MATQYVEIDDAVFMHATDSAVLLEIEDEEIWVPLSTIEDNGTDWQDDYERGEILDEPIYVAEWFARKQGWA